MYLASKKALELHIEYLKQILIKAYSHEIAPSLNKAELYLVCHLCGY